MVNIAKSTGLKSDIRINDIFCTIGLKKLGLITWVTNEKLWFSIKFPRIVYCYSQQGFWKELQFIYFENSSILSQTPCRPK